MEPVTLATSFASIVGLLVAYKGERSNNDSPQSIEDFQAWLSENNQKDALEAIKVNKELAAGIADLLSQNHEEVMSKLNQLEEQLSIIGSTIPGISAIAHATEQRPGLSKQAQSIAQQLVQVDADYCLEHHVHTGEPDDFIYIGGSHPGEKKLQITEHRHVDEDIEALQAAGIIRIEFTSRGLRKLSPTRLAYDLYKSES